MKKIVVLSDTHHNKRSIEGLFPIFEKCDMIIHLGDMAADGAYIARNFSDKTVIINGNCDIYPLGEDEVVLNVENVRLLACHGHKYGVKYGLERLYTRAKEQNCSLALYGHTHVASAGIIGEVMLINPGCLVGYGKQSYLYLELEKGVVKTCNIVETST